MEDDLFADAALQAAGRPVHAAWCAIESALAAGAVEPVEEAGFADALVPEAARRGQLAQVFGVWDAARHIRRWSGAAGRDDSGACAAGPAATSGPPGPSRRRRLHDDGALTAALWCMASVADAVLVQHAGAGWQLLLAAQAASEPAAFVWTAAPRWSAEQVAAAPCCAALLAGLDLRTMQACSPRRNSPARLAWTAQHLQYANERTQFGRPIGKFCHSAPAGRRERARLRRGSGAWRRSWAARGEGTPPRPPARGRGEGLVQPGGAGVRRGRPRHPRRPSASPRNTTCSCSPMPACLAARWPAPSPTGTP